MIKLSCNDNFCKGLKRKVVNGKEDAYEEVLMEKMQWIISSRGNNQGAENWHISETMNYFVQKKK